MERLEGWLDRCRRPACQLVLWIAIADLTQLRLQRFEGWFVPCEGQRLIRRSCWSTISDQRPD